LRQVNDAFHLMHEGKTLRSVITFPHEGDEEVKQHRCRACNLTFHASHVTRRRLKHHPRGAIVFLHGLDDKPASWQVLMMLLLLLLLLLLSLLGSLHGS
jgi:hypothetical protein